MARWILFGCFSFTAINFHPAREVETETELKYLYLDRLSMGGGGSPSESLGLASKESKGLFSLAAEYGTSGK